MAFVLSSERVDKLQEILARYPNKVAACLPLLHLCQQQHGWVSPDVIDFVSNTIEVSAAHVFGVASFYSLYNKEPVGEHQVWVCRTLSCALNGAGDILAHCEKRLGIKVGNTTADGKITLRTAECLASCGSGPMMQIDRSYHEQLTTEQVDVLLDRLLAGGTPKAEGGWI